jgi:hypothetical protein
MDSVWKKSYLIDGLADLSLKQGCQSDVLEEIALRMLRMYAPPIVNEDVEY